MAKKFSCIIRLYNEDEDKKSSITKFEACLTIIENQMLLNISSIQHPEFDELERDYVIRGIKDERGVYFATEKTNESTVNVLWVYISDDVCIGKWIEEWHGIPNNQNPEYFSWFEMVIDDDEID